MAAGIASERHAQDASAEALVAELSDATAAIATAMSRQTGNGVCQDMGNTRLGWGLGL